MEAWNHLEKSFGMAKSTARSMLLRQMKDIKLADYNTVQEYTSAYQNVYNDLISVGGKCDEVDQKVKLFEELPSEYKDLITMIKFHETKAGNTLTINQIVNQVLSWESMLKQREIKNQNSNKSSSGEDEDSEDESKNPKCPKCKKTNHTIDECYFEHPELAPEWRNKKKYGKKANDKAISWR